MSNRYFDVPQECVVEGARVSLVEKNRILDVNDPKWAFPEIKDSWCVDPAQLSICNKIWNPAFPREEQQRLVQGMLDESIKSFVEYPRESKFEEFTVPGCPEEPDAEAKCFVITPTNAKKKNNRVLFAIPGGALIAYCPDAVRYEKIAVENKCIVVVPLYRMATEAEYPACINDLHAIYKWTIDNAEMLSINPDNAGIFGYSSGAHLSLALGFRLKRYGYSPRGIVAVLPQTDDRETVEESVSTNCWDSIAQRRALMLWLGDNYCSSRIGPEALANHATIADCIGYPPTYIHSAEFDSDRDNNRMFYSKLLAARSFAEYHCWGGSKHESSNWNTEGEYHDAIWSLIYFQISNIFKYDLRRPWLTEGSEK